MHHKLVSLVSQTRITDSHTSLVRYSLHELDDVKLMVGDRDKSENL